MVEDLQTKLDDLFNQQKQLEANFHQVTGAIAMIQQMITDQENDAKEKKEEKPKKK